MKRKYETPKIEKMSIDSLLSELGIRLPNMIEGNHVSGTRSEHIFIAAYATLIEIELYKKANKTNIKIVPQIHIKLDIQTLNQEKPKLTVTISAKIEGVSRDLAKQWVDQAYLTCPYSETIKSKAEVFIELL